MKKILLTFIMALACICANAITIDDICGVYTRHMDNYKSVGGMGGAMILDITVTITAKDDNTVVLSGMMSADMPIEGTVDLEAKTITFNNQIVGMQGEVAYVLKNAWGDIADNDPVVGTIADDGTITIGDPDGLPYAGFHFSIPEMDIQMFNMYGIITLTKDKSTKWFADATYKLGNGDNISGTSTLNCTDPAVTGYDYAVNLKNYWGSYDLLIRKNDDGTLSVFNNNETAPDYEDVVYFWWMKWYDYPAWSEYLAIGTEGAKVEGDTKDGYIALPGQYLMWGAENEAELETADPLINEAGTFLITWGNPDLSAIASVKQSKSNGNVYNLAGQRVAGNTRGLYIKDGRKYIIR